jgi:hypothetical protein
MGFADLEGFKTIEGLQDLLLKALISKNDQISVRGQPSRYIYFPTYCSYFPFILLYSLYLVLFTYSPIPDS